MHSLISVWTKRNSSEELDKEIKVQSTILEEMIIAEKADTHLVMNLNLQNSKRKYMYHNV